MMLQITLTINPRMNPKINPIPSPNNDITATNSSESLKVRFLDHINFEISMFRGSVTGVSGGQGLSGSC